LSSSGRFDEAFDKANQALAMPEVKQQTDYRLSAEKRPTKFATKFPTKVYLEGTRLPALPDDTHISEINPVGIYPRRFLNGWDSLAMQ